MRSLADDVADAARALDDVIAARTHKAVRSELLLARVRLRDEQARLALSRGSSPDAALVTLLSHTQAALAFVRRAAESHTHPQLLDTAELELVALIEAIGIRMCPLPPASFRRQPALLLC